MELVESQMKPFELDIDDKYDKFCGEMFLTLKGHIVFHCSLCEGKFNGFPDYSDHVKQLHFQTFSYISDEDKGIVDEDSKLTEVTTDYQEKDEINIEILIETQEEENAADVAIDLKSNDIETLEEDEQRLLVNNSRRKPAIRKTATPNERKHKCKICGFAFTQIFNLRAHVRRHFNEKRYLCSECPKAFHTRTELETHIRRHKGERPFICEECSQPFVTAGALTMHAKRHKNIRNHECPQCDKKFFDSYALKMHMAGHTGDRPFECNSCDAAFSRKKALAVHKKIHENKREYECKYCDSSFNQKPGLYSHMKIKHSRFISDET